MLKINLSDGHGDEKKNSGEETLVREQAVTMEGSNEEEPEKPKKKSRRIQPPDKTRILILLGLLVIATLFYFQKEMILGLLGGGNEPLPQVQAPPPPSPPPPQPVEEPPAEPDPTFVALNGISGVVPERAWLSSVTILHDGSFDLKGISFSHAAMNTMAASLETLGVIASKTIPPSSKSAETVYNFRVQGKLRDIAAPDAIPTDVLVQLSETVKSRGADLGVKFSSLPKAGKTYTEEDLPFSLVGSFEGLKKTVALLCPDGGDVKVYRIIISPAAPGRAFDRVKAAFALRKTSSI